MNFWAPKMPLLDARDAQTRYYVIWYFMPIFIFSTLRIFYVKIAPSEGEGEGGRNILSCDRAQKCHVSNQFFTLLHSVCILNKLQILTKTLPAVMRQETATRLPGWHTLLEQSRVWRKCSWPRRPSQTPTSSQRPRPSVFMAISGLFLVNDLQTPSQKEPTITFIRHTFQNILRRKKKLYTKVFFFLTSDIFADR